MANWLRILLIVVAILVGAINLAIICVVVGIQLSSPEAVTEASATYTLGSSTFGKDNDTVESEVQRLLDEAYIDAAVRASYRGTPDEGWWVAIKLLHIQSEAQADLVEEKLSHAITMSFPKSAQQGFTISSFGSFTLIGLVAAAGLSSANLLVAVIATVLLIKHKRSLSSHDTTMESLLSIGE